MKLTNNNTLTSFYFYTLTHLLWAQSRHRSKSNFILKIICLRKSISYKVKSTNNISQKKNHIQEALWDAPQIQFIKAEK